MKYWIDYLNIEWNLQFNKRIYLNIFIISSIEQVTEAFIDEKEIGEDDPK